MRKIYIFGLGKGKAFADRCLLKENVEVLGIIDNYRADSLAEMDGIPVISQTELADDYDYIVVTLMKYKETRKTLIDQGISEDKLICLFDFECAAKEEYWTVLDSYKWRMELIWKHYIGTVIPSLENLNYEVYGETEEIRKQCPKIVGVDKTAEILFREKKSLARFGDGEFELMAGRTRANFQDVDNKLGERLKETLYSTNDNLLIAIANDYGQLDQYTDKAAEDIRSYMSKEVRKQHMELLDLDRVYYDAFISRPYIIYRDKGHAGKRFENIRKIWDGYDVLIVEGEYTRFGVGNDLLDNATKVSRIIVPAKNAFSKYDEIIEEVRRQGLNKLILVILGPTATVLAYDLSKEGYRIIDIGQLDVEYEWYRRGVNERCDIPYKCVSEVNQYGEILTDDEEAYIQKYKREIIAKIL